MPPQSKMALLVPLLSCLCFAALFVHPVDGLIAPRTSTHSFHAVVHKHHDHLRPRKHRKGALWSGLQENEGNDDDGDSNNNESPPQQNQQQQLQSQQQSQQQLGRNNNKQSNNNNGPSPTQVMAVMGTSPRRIFLSLASSTTIALAANFCGITSNLLSALPEEVVEKSGLDSFYPRGDYKRVTVRGSATINNVGIATNNGNSGKCSFLIPKEWVADTGLALAQAQRQARVLDYSQTKSSTNVLPDAAYGPPGRLDNRGTSSGDRNVSVIVNNGVQNFSLSSLGSDATSAAEVMLSSKFGPRSPTTLVSAVEEQRGDDINNRIPVYQFEYTVDRGEKGKPLRAISVVAGSRAGDAFVTLTVVSPEEDWEKPLVNESLRRVVESFKLV